MVLHIVAPYEKEFPMTKNEWGYFDVTLSSSENNVQYFFKPDGVHELVLYEVHVGTFTPERKSQAVISRLNDLKNTGINAIELMPVTAFPGGRKWGYDSVYPYAVQHSYGGPEGLKKLVDACHSKGIAVFLDVVYNHLGPEGNYVSEFGPYFTKTYSTLLGFGC